MRGAERAVRAATAAAMLALALPVAGQGGPDDASVRPRPDAEVLPPSYPKDADLVGFYVSPAATNRFFVDAATLAPGGDGVVRYVLVVKTQGGATNVSFEGIRCASGEYRVYAVGTDGGKWLKARGDDWREIREERVNRYRAVLAQDMFCPDGIAIRSADEGRQALRRGGQVVPASP